MASVRERSEEEAANIKDSTLEPRRGDVDESLEGAVIEGR
jgi:hypothetical protein